MEGGNFREVVRPSEAKASEPCGPQCRELFLGGAKHRSIDDIRLELHECPVARGAAVGVKGWKSHAASLFHGDEEVCDLERDRINGGAGQVGGCVETGQTTDSSTCV